MKRLISWTEKLADGIKREVRVTVSRGHMKWQYKRSDQERWDYDLDPEPADWDALEAILTRRLGRGRGVNMIETVRRMRMKAGC